MPLSLLPQPLAFHSFHFHQLHPPGFTPAHLSPSLIVPPLRASSISLSFRIRAIRLVPIPVTRLIFRFLHRDLSVSIPLYIFPLLVEVVYRCLPPVRCHETPLLFSTHLSFLEQPCQQLSFFLFRFSFSSILDTPRHASPSLIHPLYFSISPCFLTHIHPPVFPTLLPSFHISRFPSLLRCPSGRSTLFSDSHQPYLDAALPTKVRGALFPTPAGVQPGGTCVRSTSIDLF